MAPSISLKPMGHNGPLVPVLGFGAMGISGLYGTITADPERLAVLDRAYSLGVRHWDTADMYGDSEELLGTWFAKNPSKRKDIFLATKFGAVIENGALARIRSDPEYVRIACEKSLKRLGVKSIDLYYCHRVDEKTPIELTVRALLELQKEGKIKYIGFSELSAASLRRACAVAPITALQMEYSPFELSIESPTIQVLAAARELGVALVAYSPLGRGFMTGQYRSPDDFEDGDARKAMPRYSAENFPKNLVLLEKFEEIASKKGCKAGQLCLAWLMAQGDDIFPIPGTKKIKYLEENADSTAIVLTKRENAEIRQLIEAAEVHGDRAVPGYAFGMFADTPLLEG